MHHTDTQEECLSAVEGRQNMSSVLSDGSAIDGLEHSTECILKTHPEPFRRPHTQRFKLIRLDDVNTN